MTKQFRRVVPLVSVVFTTVMSAGVAVPPAQAETISISLHLKQLPLSARKGSRVDQVGDLVYRGGIRIISSERRFGGLSGLIVSRDGGSFLSVSDQADWVTGTLNYQEGQLVGISDVTIGPILDEQGNPLVHKKGDAEAVEQLDPGGPFPGSVVVSFERHHRLWRYDLQDNGFETLPSDLQIPTQMESIEDNRGIEALHVTDDGAIIAVTEGTFDDDGRTLGWVMQLNEDKQSVARSEQILLETWDTFRPTDLTRLPDGRFFVLQRHFSPQTGPIIQIRDLGDQVPQQGDVLAGKLLAQFNMAYNIDNMEGIAARQTEDGRTLIYIVSDDNFNPLQRTVLLMFEVMPKPEPEPATPAETE